MPLERDPTVLYDDADMLGGVRQLVLNGRDRIPRDLRVGLLDAERILAADRGKARRQSERLKQEVESFLATVRAA